MPSRVWDEVKDFFRRLTDVKVGPIGVRVEPRDQSRDRDIPEPTIEPEEEEPRRIRLQQLDVDVLSELAQRDNDEEETELEDLVDALDLGRLECEHVLHRLCDAGFLECLEDGTLRLTREGVEYAVRRRLF